MFIKILIVEKNPGKLRSKAFSLKRVKSQYATPPRKKKYAEAHMVTCLGVKALS